MKDTRKFTDDLNYLGDPRWLQNLRRIHPFKVIIYIAMGSIGIMFTFLSVSFLLTHQPGDIYLPRWFALSTIALLTSSITMSRAVFFYKADQVKDLHVSLILTFFLALFFIYAQMRGWKELADQGIYFEGKANGSYIYLLSGLHLLHFFGGVALFFIVYFRVLGAYRDTVKNLIYVTDPYEKMLLELLAIYWHFMDALWLVLYLIFLIN